MISLYRFDEAPEELQALSDHGGDEDWLAIVQKADVADWWPVTFAENHDMNQGDVFPLPLNLEVFGVCCTSIHEHGDSWVLIGAHV